MLTYLDGVGLCLDLLEGPGEKGVGCHGSTLHSNYISNFRVVFNQGSVGGFLCQHSCIQGQNCLVVRWIDIMETLYLTVQVSLFLGLLFFQVCCFSQVLTGFP